MPMYSDNIYSIDDESNWKITHCPKGYAFVVKRENNSVVCSLYNGLTPMDKSLARMLSASPELLSSLENLLGSLMLTGSGDYISCISRDDLAVARAAIKKARGQE
ncbi:hypothetical protein UFOVP746_29 [uncultured Caudovirales phage]|uniref:Uncharacterized protein n=1 Tax=uncultured Caudovirales phage TaxID=2100421 RepID=A0A6J7XCL3_9CAUD|nr:hypothetical protein UFOVP746_29 [uncultured Caudovirales phage]